MGHAYLSILIYTALLAFFLGIKLDALRAEGLLPAMAAITLLSALLNIAFGWLFLVQIGWVVEGSAWGTVLAQVCAIAALLAYRANHSAGLNWPSPMPAPAYCRDLLALGRRPVWGILAFRCRRVSPRSAYKSGPETGLRQSAARLALRPG